MKKKVDKTEAGEAESTIPTEPSRLQSSDEVEPAEVPGYTFTHTVEPLPPPEVYAAIAGVIGDLAKHGISKDRRNTSQGQGFAFRGIDDVYNALSSLLSKYQLVMLPRVLSRTVTERQTQKGGTLFYVVLEVEYDLVSAKDGSHHTIRVFGEAMDSGDKATNKSMSAAYKYAALQTFCIPTEGDNDPDATTPEPIKPRQPEPPDRLPPDWEQSRSVTPKAPTIPKPRNVAPGASQSVAPKTQNNPAQPKPVLQDRSLEKLAEDLHKQLESWRFPSGANTGKSLLDLGFENAKRYAEWVRETSEKNGQAPLPYQQDAVEMVEVFRKFVEASEELGR